MTEHVDVAVVGGGIAGLAAARALSATHRVVLLEADERFGGKLLTGELGGRPLDLGPDAFLTRRPAAEALCRALGLGDDLVAPAASGAALYARGALRPFPSGLVLGVPTDLAALRRSGVVGLTAVLRCALDLVLPGRSAPEHLLERLDRGGPDPTIADVVGRRLGRSVLQSLADPLLGGINAGDARSLSFAGAAPSLAVLAAGHRSLMRALRARPSPEPAVCDSAPRPVFLGLRSGLGTLAERLSTACREAGVELRPASSVHHLEPRASTRWRITSASGSLEASGVVLATPSYAAATALGPYAPELAGALSSIPYASVATLTLAFQKAAIGDRPRRELAALASRAGALDESDGTRRAELLPGTGVLVPRDGSFLVTAATFTSTKWPHAVPSDLVALRVSVGRYGDERHAALDDRQLLEAVRADLVRLIGVTDAPVEVVLQRWPRSFPQYLSGHRALVAGARERCGELPPLFLAGAAYDGIGIPSCIESGERTARGLAFSLER